MHQPPPLLPGAASRASFSSAGEENNDAKAQPNASFSLNAYCDSRRIGTTETKAADSQSDTPLPTAEYKALGITLVLVCGAILAVAALLDFSTLGAPPICAFYRATGLPCGGCGLSRSCSAIAHGRWEQAWEFNPFGYFFMALFIVGFVGGALTVWRPALRPHVLPGARVTTYLFVAVTIALAIFGVWRLTYIIGWEGVKARLFGGSGGNTPPSVLLHGDPTIARPPPPPLPVGAQAAPEPEAPPTPAPSR